MTSQFQMNLSNLIQMFSLKLLILLINVVYTFFQMLYHFLADVQLSLQKRDKTLSKDVWVMFLRFV